MKKLLLHLFLLFSVAAWCQPGDTMSNRERKQYQKDSVISFYKNKRDSLTKALLLSDTSLIKENIRTNTDYFVRLQKESRAKKKREAILRIVLGAALFALLIIGLQRRSKK